MVNSLEFDLIICGSGLAGLRAAIAAAKKGPHLKIGIVSKVQVMRSHSVSAEGGTAAVLFEDEGDTIESHVYDTVKGSDFLADQDVAERLCVEMPQEIHQLDHWGMPWSRRDNGQLIKEILVVIVFLEQHMHLIKLVSLKCKLCMIHVRNMIILNILTNGL